MDDFLCPRCGYETDRIDNFKRHLERRNICLPKIADISLQSLKDKFLKTKIIVCTTCNKTFSSSYGLTKHTITCKDKISKDKRIDNVCVNS